MIFKPKQGIIQIGSAEYANLKICILRNELLKDCDEMQLISSDSLTLLSFEDCKDCN